MSKIMFWVMIVVVATIGIYIEKMIAAQSGIQGLKDFLGQV